MQSNLHVYMRLALVGGTGDIGEGLALRFARDTDVDVLIGSREAEKAERAVDSYEDTLSTHGIDVSLSGYGNAEATRRADVVVLAVPPYYVADTVEAITDALDDETIVVSPAVGMTGDEDGLHYKPPSQGSVAALVADRLPEGVPLVGACTNLSASRLADLDDDVAMDTLVFGDDQDAKDEITELVGRLAGIRPLDAGPLGNAPEIESLTPLLVTLARYNDDLHDAGVRFV